MVNKALTYAARDARGLAINAIAKAKSGHMGLPLGAAEIGAALFGVQMRYSAKHPHWLNRDRFVLSAGHGSMFLYAWLHMAGYDVPMKEIENFRQFGSETPGHPEFNETPGVEATTGPLGQGIANAVGYAISAKMCAARFNTSEHKIFDQTIYALAGDGCLQEGISYEAAALAGHLALDNLVLIYDSNDVTLDGPASDTQSEDAAARFKACGWNVQQVDGHDIAALCAALDTAKSAGGKPQLVIARTVIGKGVEEVQGTSKAHGEGGAKFAASARAAWGLPEEQFHVSPETLEFFTKRAAELDAQYCAWEKTFAAWQAANPALAKELDAPVLSAQQLLAAIPQFAADTNIATRKAGGDVLQSVAKAMGKVVSGSADLHGSNLNYIKDGGNFTRDNRTGRNLLFGIREHAMCGILNGIAYDGILHPSGATFLVFSDYARGAIRLAALAKLPVVYIFTHDSVAVGEDGPTHEPVETIAALRAIPGLDVIRPADPEETAGAYAAAFSRTDGPTALILTRQNLPLLAAIPVAERREGVLRGGYVALREAAPLERIILSCGSELQLALAAAEKLGAGTRVVSLPCFERFEAQDVAYRESVLPASCRNRVSIEAAITTPWYRYVGLDGRALGIERFGISAPADIVLRELGMTVECVVAHSV